MKVLRRRKNLSVPRLLAITFVMAFCFASQAAGASFFTASWYAIADLKSSGQYSLTKGVMANGKQFSDEAFTCASRDYNLGTIVRVTNLANGRFVVVKVTDRINKRFKGKRIDLSKGAFSKLLSKGETLDKGLLKVKVEK